jgi:hypothetical protein
VQRLYERKNARKIYRPAEEGECWKIITNDEIK